jgi:hypothetical protein
MAIDMTLPGLLAHRSALQGGCRLEIPDITRADVRDEYRHDSASPYPRDDSPNQVPPSIAGIPSVKDGVHVEKPIDCDDTLAKKLGSLEKTVRTDQ